MQEEMKRTLAPCRRAAALLAGLHSLYALLLDLKNCVPK